MKTFISLLIIVLYSCTLSKSDVYEYKIPVVKESIEIDHLLNPILNLPIKKKSFIILDCYYSTQTFYLHPILVNSTSDTINFYKKKGVLGCLFTFDYHNHKIFITGLNRTNRFFTSTIYKSKVIFKTDFNIRNKTDSLNYVRNYFQQDFYKYQNSHFISTIEPVY